MQDLKPPSDTEKESMDGWNYRLMLGTKKEHLLKSGQDQNPFYVPASCQTEAGEVESLIATRERVLESNHGVAHH